MRHLGQIDSDAHKVAVEREETVFDRTVAVLEIVPEAIEITGGDGPDSDLSTHKVDLQCPSAGVRVYANPVQFSTKAGIVPCKVIELSLVLDPAPFENPEGGREDHLRRFLEGPRYLEGVLEPNDPAPFHPPNGREWDPSQLGEAGTWQSPLFAERPN
jgi:hypothetical protein